MAQGLAGSSWWFFRAVLGYLPDSAAVKSSSTKGKAQSDDKRLEPQRWLPVTMSDDHIAVLGAGSVGLCLAAPFAMAGASVSPLARGASVPALQGQGITVTGLLGDHVSANRA